MWRALGVVFLVAVGTAIGLIRSPTFQVFGDAVARVETQEMVVALTFDDGPTARHTADVIDMLATLDVTATFYVNGAPAAAAPAALSDLVAAGHEIGNHSWSHGRMILRRPSWVRDEIERTTDVIRAAGFEGPLTFRPPYGDRLVVLPWVLSQMEMTTVMWDVSPESGLADDAGTDEIVEAALVGAQPGSIIGMHVMFDHGAASRAALPLIVEGLRARGYQFVTVSELLALREDAM